MFASKVNLVPVRLTSTLFFEDVNTLLADHRSLQAPKGTTKALLVKFPYFNHYVVVRFAKKHEDIRKSWNALAKLEISSIAQVEVEEIVG